MRKLSSRCLALLTLGTLLPIAACSETGRWQLVADAKSFTYRIDTISGDTWRTTGTEWVLVRVAPRQKR